MREKGQGLDGLRGNLGSGSLELRKMAGLGPWSGRG